MVSRFIEHGRNTVVHSDFDCMHRIYSCFIHIFCLLIIDYTFINDNFIPKISGTVHFFLSEDV